MNTLWRHIIVNVAVLGMEGGCIYILLDIINSKALEKAVSVPGILVFFPAAFIVNGIMNRARWPRVVRWLVSGIAWALAAVIALRAHTITDTPLLDLEWIRNIFVPGDAMFLPAIVIVLSGAVIWWLGARIARSRGNFALVVSEFQFGLFILVILLFTGVQLDAPMGSALPAVIVFFVCGLGGISIAHALEGTGWFTGNTRSRWLVIVAICIVLIILAGLLINILLSPDILRVVWDAIAWVASRIWDGIMYLFSLIANLFSSGEPMELPPAPEMEMVPQDQGISISMPDGLRKALQIGWTVIMAAAILVALWKIASNVFSWLRRRLGERDDVEYESIRGAFRADILQLIKRIGLVLKNFINRVLRLRSKTADTPAEQTDVIHVYSRLQRWAASAGHPRNAAQTPYEFSGVLTKLLPEAAGDLNTVTDVYAKVKYGAWQADEEDITGLHQAWGRLKRFRLEKAVNMKDNGKEVQERGRNENGNES